MDELSLQRIFKLYQVRHQERLKDLYRSASAHREAEMRLTEASQALWKRALECSPAKQSGREREVYAHRKEMLAQADAALQQEARRLKQSHGVLAHAQERATQSEAATDCVERAWRSRSRRDALRLDDEQGEEVVGLAVSRQAVQSAPTFDATFGRCSGESVGAGSGFAVAASFTGKLGDHYPSDAALMPRTPREAVAVGSLAQGSLRPNGDGTVALRIKESLPSGDTVSIEVRQSEGLQLDATVVVSDGFLLSRLVKEKKLLLARLDAAQLSIGRFEVLADDSPRSGERQSMMCRRRAPRKEGDDDEITLT